MIVLGIESSCDETAASVVRNGTEVLSSVIFSQVSLHQPYGGVVPEIASRSHIEKISGVVREAIIRAFSTDPDVELADLKVIPPAYWAQIDAIAGTYGPGLASSLIVGWSAAKGIAVASGKPLIAINHLQAHLHSVRLGNDYDEATLYPQLGVCVSGGHTSIIDCQAPNEYTLIGQTMDDAAGEALDKAAKLLGLGYPGGPLIDKLSRDIPESERKDIPFPKGRISANHPLAGDLRHELCMSYSGLKTALMLYVKNTPPQSETETAKVCACYQEAVVGALVDRIALALKANLYQSLAVGGGVSLNSRLRVLLERLCAKSNVQLLLAAPANCGDNAAMIAGLASQGGGRKGDTLALDVFPSLEVFIV